MKYLLKLFFVCSLLLISGCQTDSNYTLIEDDNDYQVYAYADSDGILSDYTYFIFNDNGDKIDSGYNQSREPIFQKFDNHVLKRLISAGTNVNFTTYYDLSRSLISDEYENVYYDDGELVVYIHYDNQNDSTYVTAKKIFDSDFLLNEKLDLDGIFTTDYHVEVKDNRVTVQHVKGPHYDDVVETFELSLE